MATPIQLEKNNLYSNGFIIELEEGELLKRNPFTYGGNQGGATEGDETHTVVDGDYLWDIAYKYYGDSKLWWIIGDANNIYNPFELSLGVELIIPDFETINAII